VKVTMTAALEPTDMLDAAALAVVNGPEDDLPGWDQIDWTAAEREVRRLRQRIFTASRDGDLKKVRSLQRLMLRSRSNALVGVRRVAEQNTGRNTAGIDGVAALLPETRNELARWVQQRSASWLAAFFPRAA
jgi:RNA-directed DNA polymerase